MLCRHCGTEIADKAIVCYRCGAATTDPVRRAAPIRPRRSRLLPLVGLLLLVLAGLFLGEVGRTVQPEYSDRYMTASGVLVGVAVALLLMRLVRRR